MTVNEIKKYSKKDHFSYSFGTFPTFELIRNKSDIAEMVLVHSNINEDIYMKLFRECQRYGIRIIESSRCIEKVRDKENCIVIGVFNKYLDKLEHDKNHVVLVNPSDAGNLGTIIRSCIGFGISNLAIIEPSVDIFQPNVIRASMGAIFKMKIQCFSDFEQYYREYGDERECYPFMLNGKYHLGTFEHSSEEPYTLIFGNEASGLDESFLRVGRSVVIAHTDSIDSLNLAVAAGIGIYEFGK